MKRIFVLSLILLAMSCKENKLPKGILTSDKMVKILIDMHIVEGKLSLLKYRKDSAASIYLELENKVFKKHKVTQKKYINSYRYYISHPELMDDIYSAVVDSLNVRQKILKLD